MQDRVRFGATGLEILATVVTWVVRRHPMLVTEDDLVNEGAQSRVAGTDHTQEVP